MAPRVSYCDEFVLPLPAEHRFPMAKYRLLRERLVDDRVVAASELTVPEPVEFTQLALAHDPLYVDRVREGRLDARAIRRLGFPWSPQLVMRSRRSVGGTLAASRAALEIGVGVNLAGGTHHAFADRGEGYCVFNDAAVAIRVLTAEGLVTRAVVIDCDVHQGDGTAAIFAADPAVATFSIHGRRNYPFRKETSTVDVALEDGTGDALYIGALAEHLPPLLRRHRPELAVYVAGADPWSGDRLGRLGLSKAALRERDECVLSWCAEAATPVAVVMAGGYAPRVEDIVDIHAATVAVAVEHGRRQASNGIMQETRRLLSPRGTR